MKRIFNKWTLRSGCAVLVGVVVAAVAAEEMVRRLGGGEAPPTFAESTVIIPATDTALRHATETIVGTMEPTDEAEMMATEAQRLSQIEPAAGK